MHKALAITWKDLLVLFRDRAALILMFVAPLALTLGLGAITGTSGDQTSSIGNIPLIMLNQDRGEMGQVFAQALTTPELGGLFAVEAGNDLAVGRKQVELDQVAALILIPPNFSDSLLPKTGISEPGPIALLQIYTSPERPNSAQIVQLVVSEILNEMAAQPLANQVSLEGLLASGRLVPNAGTPSPASEQLAQPLASIFEEPLVRLRTPEEGSQPDLPPNVLGYLAPAFAVFFLMYTVSLGGRSILIEREYGTLARLLTTPTSSSQVLGGKVFGIFVSGVIQVGVLVLVSGLLFGLDWGDPLAAALLVISVSLAATGWGILLASLATSPWQVGGIGSALMIIFGLLGGTFIPASQFPEAVRTLAKLTPNYWSNSGFMTLISGGSLDDVAEPILALLIMAAGLFIAAVLLARKRWTSGFIRK